MKELFIFILILIIHLIATDFTYKKGNQLVLLNESNYYDIIHHNFKDYSSFHYYKNLITFLFVVPFLFNLDKLTYVPNKLLYIIPTLIILRSIFTSVTIFPATRTNGPNQEQQKQHINFFNYFVGDNHDRMFSGHICFAVILSYLMFYTGIFSVTTVPLISIILLNIIHAFIIVVTRSHYTIDVLNSSIITLLLLVQI